MKSSPLLTAAVLLPALLSPGGCGSSGSGSTPADGGGGGSSSGSSGGGSGSGGSSGSSGSSGSGGSSGGSSTSGGGSTSGGSEGGLAGHAIKSIFIILMENNNWSDIYQQTSIAPYINGLLTNSAASWCTQYFDNPSAVHPSEPNYIWLEAGNNLTFTTDADPSAGNESSAPHLTKLMDAAGVSWKAYAEGVTAGSCPIASTGLYAPKHVPFVFFSDVVGSPPSATAAHCVDHVVPYTQLATDIAAGTVAQYNFITPNLCDDMHGATSCPASITDGDTWLGTEVPKIMASAAYKDGGALFITWDESEGGELPIGMIALSPEAKGSGYQSTKKYYHSSFVRTVEEVFGLSPFLNDAANQSDLSDLFKTFP